MIVTFGEVMGRLAPPGFRRFRQNLPGPVNITFAGAEANVAAAVALLGGEARFVTALPRHAIAAACLDQLRGLGIDTGHILRTDGGRFGLFFLEVGANQRPSQVVYDREGTSLALTPGDQYPWTEIFEGAQWFHVSGITPAVSQLASEATLMAVQSAKKAGLTVSCDLNFRKKLWTWDPQKRPKELAEATMRKLLRFVDVMIANEEDCGEVLQVEAGGTDVNSGTLEIDRYPDVARQVAMQFPQLKMIAYTLRESLSATHNNWGAMLYETKQDLAHFAPRTESRYEPYQIRNIVDRVGAGDAFAGGLIYALTHPELSKPSTAVRFATAASCLAHSTEGDFNISSRTEVEALMTGSTSGRVVR